MIDLCFSDSVKGALRCAQHDGIIGGAISIAVIGESHENEKELYEQQICRTKNVQSLGGDPKDVLGLSWGLSIGDIAAPLSPICLRRELLYQWLTADPWDEMGEMEAQAEEYWQNCLADYDRLITCAAQEPVRIWVDYTPDSLCGLLFAADILYKLDASVTYIPLPSWVEEPAGVIKQYSGWGDVCPEEFGQYLSDGKPLTKNVLRLLAGRWKELQKENAPMRAFINGRVIGVNEDFYDPFIRQSFVDGNMHVAQLIGRVLGSQRLGISDWVIAQRIKHMLLSGELQLVREDSRFYHATVRKT